MGNFVMFESLAKELREAREKAGISKQEAASKIRIDLKFLEAMEEGNFTFLAEVYVKAFLRDYAKLLTLNDKAVIKKYEMLRDGKTETAAPLADGVASSAEASQPVQPDLKRTGEQEFVDESLERARIADKKKMMFAAIAGAVIVLAVFVYILLSDRSDEVVIERPFSEVLEQNRKRYEEPQKPDTDSLAPARDSLRLRIRATDTVWISVIPDAGRVAEYRIFPGKYIDLSASEKFSVHIGNSYAVLFELNGKIVSLPAQRPRVYKGIITAKGVL